MQPSSDGRHLVVAGGAGELQFLAIDQAFAHERTFKAGPEEIGCVTFSDDRQLDRYRE